MTLRTIVYVRRSRSPQLAKQRFLINVCCSVLALMLVASGPSVWAQETEAPAETPADQTASEGESPETNAGQADLDEAVIQRIDAKSAQQLEAVSALLQSAITKGLDEENESFAR